MIFNVEYNSDVTFVFCHEYQTCTIITRDDQTGMLGLVDNNCNHKPQIFLDPQEALDFAMYSAEYCAKDDTERIVIEEGDRAGYFRGARTLVHTIVTRPEKNRTRRASWRRDAVNRTA